MNPLAPIGRYGHAAGTSGTVTVTATNGYVTSVTCYSSAGGTLTITPGGPNQIASALTAIVIPAGIPFSFPPHVLDTQVLGPGTVLVFASTDSYLVTFSRNITGS